MSKEGKFFSAMMQFNKDRQWVEFLFERNLKGASFSEVHHSERVSLAFRGKELRRWQIEKLKAWRHRISMNWRAEKARHIKDI